MSTWSEDEDEDQQGAQGSFLFPCDGLMDCDGFVDRPGKMCFRCQAKSGITYGKPNSPERKRWYSAMGAKKPYHVLNPKIVARRHSPFVKLYPNFETFLKITV
jgi:hypothetical protein